MPSSGFQRLFTLDFTFQFTFEHLNTFKFGWISGEIVQFMKKTILLISSIFISLVLMARVRLTQKIWRFEKGISWLNGISVRTKVDWRHFSSLYIFWIHSEITNKTLLYSTYAGYTPSPLPSLSHQCVTIHSN